MVLVRTERQLSAGDIRRRPRRRCQDPDSPHPTRSAILGFRHHHVLWRVRNSSSPNSRGVRAIGIEHVRPCVVQDRVTAIRRSTPPVRSGAPRRTKAWIRATSTERKRFRRIVIRPEVKRIGLVYSPSLAVGMSTVSTRLVRVRRSTPSAVARRHGVEDHDVEAVSIASVGRRRRCDGHDDEAFGLQAPGNLVHGRGSSSTSRTLMSVVTSGPCTRRNATNANGFGDIHRRQILDSAG